MNEVTGKYIHTPLGVITVRIKGMDPGDYWIKLIDANLETVPMTSDACVAAIMWIRPQRAYRWARCECFWEDPPTAPSPNSSEHLAALKWETKDWRVEIGTEDEHEVTQRLPHLRWNRVCYPVDYSEIGLAFNLPPLDKGSFFSLHFAVAWISMARLDQCFDLPGGPTWYAIDHDHEHLLKLVQNDDSDTGDPAP